MLRGQSFICEKPGEEVRIEDLGSDQEEEEVRRQTERREFRYQPKGKKMPGRRESGTSLQSRRSPQRQARYLGGRHRQR